MIGKLKRRNNMHCIGEKDIGYLSGDTHWHGLPQYVLVGGRAVSLDEASRTTNFDVLKLPTFVNPELPSGSYSVVRRDEDGTLTVLAPAVGERYVATPHKSILNMIGDGLLALFPLKIAGAGTLSNGATWWIQLVSEKYFIRGDESPNEQRLSYSHTYGVDAHSIFCTTTRIVCNNTRRMAMADAAANKMMRKHKHTKSAEMKINADMELMAELHLAVERDKELMEVLAGQEVNTGLVSAFMQEFFPRPQEDASTKSKNRWESDSRTVSDIFHSGQHMTGATRTSKYALLNAYTDWADHHSYSRSDVDRWMDSQSGKRSNMKELATEWLLAH
jgi:phage/plasmid-like protein (TIGR03299 family)